MSEIKLTKDQASRIFNSLDEVEIVKGNEYYFIKRLQEEGWIVKDKIETAIEELNKYYDSFGNLKDKYFEDLYNYSKKVIELLQNKVKELESK